MSVLPSQEIVVSWNHAVWQGLNQSKENEALGLLMAAVRAEGAGESAGLELASVAFEG